MSKSISIADIFIKEAIKTESCNFTEIVERLSDKRTIRLLHAAMGLSTEANEFLDALKKWIFYGKQLDEINLAEEIGDNFWYAAIASDELGKSFEEIQIAVIQKLRKRYAEKFNSEEAIDRNIEHERAILEDNFLNSAGGFSRTERDRLSEFGKNFGVGDKVNDLPKLFENNEKLLQELTENAASRVKMEILDEPITHWLSDVEKLTVLCLNRKDEEKYTLEEALLTCNDCIDIRNHRLNYGKHNET
jgi:NTP pyrophosphatase (non-canonical NTP hydrolase)